MAKRRSPGEGSVFQASDGRWHAWLELPAGPVGLNGRPTRRRRKLTGSTRKEVAAKLKAAGDELTTGVIPEARLTVGAYLDRWLDRRELAADLAAGTVAGYRDIIGIYIKPAIGTRRLATLTPTAVEEMTGNLLASGRAPRTAAIARAVLRRALTDAVRDGLIARNVAQLARPPRQPRTEGRTLELDQARTLLDHVSGHPLETAFVLSLMLGLRRGELLGLQYGDLELDAGRLTVRRQLRAIGQRLELTDTKTAGSVRVLNLPGPASAALRRHVTERPGLPGALLFTTPAGAPIHPAVWTRTVGRVTAAALGGHWSPHALRHSCASIMLAAGVPLKTVSTVLGHSSIRVTADVYAHLLADDTTAADAMTSAMAR